MPRTTDAAVRQLFPKDQAALPVSHYVADASLLVTEILGTSGLTAGRLELVERYLAAHLYVLGTNEGGVMEETIGQSTVKLGSSFALGAGLRLTRFGQMAISFDTTGKLEDMSASVKGKKKAEFRVV